ncbi:MAG: hypothetical protein KGI35_05910 [Burkholderiales bacterium]|nr:hypothetical protein [Burkholderiales bacterium]
MFIDWRDHRISGPNSPPVRSRRIMPLLTPTRFEGVYIQPQSGRRIDYEVECQVVIDGQGRESIHVRGSLTAGGQKRPLIVMGRVDPHRSFVGRERAVALDCIGAACKGEFSALPPQERAAA